MNNETLKALALQSVLCSTLVAGHWHGIEIAYNLSLAAGWAIPLMFFLCLFADPNKVSPPKSPGIKRIINFAFPILMCAAGWFATASFYSLCAFLFMVKMDTIRELKATTGETS